ncbi:hypothetical protein CTAYLR_008307 [Chrysophaeum taylorii]|uniref:HD/PDEase domain-containing protein n=1 Tax=Chrysophaeum taylorii TaxID=2483200 RepID=A0AAD7XFB1_9STRA|nr:hypothetical protein CTAYLR_008307 [Chrysophaeum taylorii]
MEVALQRLRSLFEAFGGGAYTIGEAMSITQHSAQAAQLARAAGERDAAVVAALFHDVGHLLGFEAGLPAEMDGCGFEAHDSSGGAFLTQLGFEEDVGWLAAQHVRAKRYRVAVDPAYANKLSEASKTTLRFQGGPMSPAEVAACDADPRWPEALRLRSYDEGAKEEEPYKGFSIDAIFEEYMPAIERTFSPKKTTTTTTTRPYVLSAEQLRKWDEDGFLVVRRPDPSLTAERLGEMAEFLATVDREAYPMCLVHRERPLNGGPPQICRVENFCKHEPRWRDLCLGLVQDLVSQVTRRPAVLFKDKINFKGPGGGGFLCHQDATAYATDKLATRHVSALVAVDAATVENGALQISPGRHNEGIFPNDRGVVRDDVDLDFSHVLVDPGDVVLFDSYLPHKSDANTTDTWRRSAFLTFNSADEGDFHEAYYAKKAEVIQQGAISINLDFGGTIVPDE